MSDYATKKELEHAAGADTSNLAAKNDFIALKAESDKLDINELVNVPTCLNNLKAKIGNLNVDKFNTVPIDLKKLSDIVSKEVVKKAAHDKLNTKVNNLEKKIPGASILIQSIQYNTDKKIWRTNW